MRGILVGSIVVRVIGVLAAAACLGAGGCAPKSTVIVSSPPGAYLTVDSVALGRSPSQFMFNFSDRRMSIVEATLDGYYPANVTVTPDTQGVREGKLTIPMQQDDAWLATTF